MTSDAKTSSTQDFTSRSTELEIKEDIKTNAEKSNKKSQILRRWRPIEKKESNFEFTADFVSEKAEVTFALPKSSRFTH